MIDDSFMIEKRIDAPSFDDRERASGLISYLEQLGYPFLVEQRLIGDCAISNRIVYEIKRVSLNGSNDLRSSLFDDRIHQQSKSRHENYEINILIIEIEKVGENIANPFDSAFTPQHLKSLRQTLELSFDCHVHFTSSMKETVDLIYADWEHEKKGKKYISDCNPAPRPKTFREQQIYFLSGLLNIGDKSALELLDYFKTPIEIIKWIIQTELQYTKTGNPKSPVLPQGLSGYGHTFFEKNQTLLLKMS